MFMTEIANALDCGEFINLEIKQGILEFLGEMESDLTDLKYNMGGDAEKALISLRKKLEDLEVEDDEVVAEVVVEETVIESDPLDVELDDDEDEDDEFDDDEDVS
jgi:hypothetical protein